MPDAARAYFDTNLYFNKFEDLYKLKPETNNMFNKVKSGEFHLVISQSIFMEIYHVLCLPLERITNFKDAQAAIKYITVAYDDIKGTILQFPNTELAENEFDGIDSKNLIDFVESVPGSNLIEFFGKKLPGSMDFMQLMVASNLNCEKFFTYDEGLIKLQSNHKKGNIEIIRPYKA